MKGGKHTGDCLPENKNPCKKLHYDPVDLFCGTDKKGFDVIDKTFKKCTGYVESKSSDIPEAYTPFDENGNRK